MVVLIEAAQLAARAVLLVLLIHRLGVAAVPLAYALSAPVQTLALVALVALELRRRARCSRCRQTGGGA